MNFPIAILVYELILQIFRKIVLIMIIDFLLFYDFIQETQGCCKVNMVKTESNIARGMVEVTQIWRSSANVFSSGKKNDNWKGNLLQAVVTRFVVMTAIIHSKGSKPGGSC